MPERRACPNCGFASTYSSAAMADHHHARHSCSKRLRQQAIAQRRLKRTRSAPTRECHHPRARHTHGTRAAYVRDRCRCANCTAANTTASNEMHRARTFGRWKPYIDAAPVRAHIQTLRQIGVGVDQIASLAGLSSSHVRGLIYPTGRSNRPFQKIRRETARRILSIPPDVSSRAANSHVDATGTRRRLQALVTVGWTQTSLARALHRSSTNLRRSMSGETVTACTAQLVDDLYERLWDTEPPEVTTAQRRPSEAAHSLAARQGWLPPLAWDDIDNDPEPRPSKPTDVEDDLDEIALERAMNGDATVQLTHTEQVEVVRRMSERGRSIRTIAETLSTSTRTVSRHRKQSREA
jgi:AraC-like DNA-binding protein